jgi:hypothetical protein
MNNVEVQTTPFGEGLYPFLSKPDMQFNSEGIYQVKLKVKKAEAQKDIKIINDVIASEIAKEHKAKPGNTGLLKRASLPYVIEGDDVTFKFKTKFKPVLVDANTKPIPEDKNIWGGSIMRVNYKPVGYNVASTGIGCTLRLISCQITKLVEGSSATKGFSIVGEGQ